MHCPRCAHSPLDRAIRQSVEVDFCTSCLGVWFDRGEVERAFNRLSAVDPADLPERWEPIDHELGPSLFADLVNLESSRD
ncbi:MAG: zf-TFIIB domain-containing protein [Ilumatobacteraceae bacterium]